MPIVLATSAVFSVTPPSVPPPTAVSASFGNLTQGSAGQVQLIDVLAEVGTVYSGTPTITINSQIPSNLGATVDTTSGPRPQLSIPTSTLQASCSVTWTLTQSGGAGSSQATASGAVVAAPSGITAAPVAAFGHSVQDVTALGGWPAGRTPTRIVTQGSYVHGYVRRSWKLNNNNGHYLDFQAGWRKTTAPDTIRVELDNASQIDLAISATHAIPAPGSGGTTRTLDAAGGGNYTDWSTAIAALAANDVLVVRAPAGNLVYTQDNNAGGPTSTVSGVNIVAHPDDLAAGRRPRIHVKGTVFKRYADNLNSGNWEVYQALGGNHGTVWRTTAAVGALVNIGCSYKSVGGGLKRCWTYTNTSGTPGALARLTDTTYPRVGVDQPDVPANWNLYMGPGIYLHSDNKLYIRLTPLTDGIGAVQVNKALGTGYPNPPWNWTDDAPANTDPNQCQLYISSSNDDGTIGITTNTSYVLRINSTSNWVIENLDFVGGGDTIQMRSGNGHTVRGCRFLGWAPPYFAGDSTSTDTVQRRHNMFAAVNTFTLTVDRCEMWGGTPPWVGWSDNKGQMGAYSLAAAAAVMFSMHTGTDTDISFSGTFRHCLMDGWVTVTKPGGTPQFVKYHNCSLRYFGLDGGHGVQNPSETIDFIRCQLFTASPFAWIATAAKGSQKFGYNLICNFRPFMHYWAYWTINSKSDPNEFIGASHAVGHGGSSWRDCLDHYHYNNTSIGSHNSRRMSCIKNNGGANEGMAFDGTGAAVGALPFEQNAYYRTYYSRNNVMAVRHNNSRGNGANSINPSGDSHVAVVPHSTHIGFGQGATVTYTVDYNLYHRSSSMPTLGGNNRDGVITTVNTARTETARNLISDVQSDTGQEAHGRIADPLFVGAWDPAQPDRVLHTNAFWCLQAGSPAVSGGDTTARSWPDVDFGSETTYKGPGWLGCMDPNASAVEQQIGILGPQIS